MGRTEVTEKQWNALMNGRMEGSNLPKTQVSLADAADFVKKLNARQDGFVYSVPTEAQWEYAARAGDNRERLEPLAGEVVYSTNAPLEIARYKPNGFGLYDVLGNAAEWTADGVVKGGSFHSSAPLFGDSLTAAPETKSPEIGIRILRQKVR